MCVCIARFVFDTPRSGHEEEEESAVDAEAKRRRDGKRGGSGGGGRSSSYVASFSEPDPPHTTSAIFPRLSIPVPAVPRRQSSGSVMSMSFSGSYPGNTSLEQLRRGLILPSPLIGASARESPYASGSDEYGRAYNSDPDLPSSMQ